MNTEEILDVLNAEHSDEELLLADGFEDALLGVAIGAGRPVVTCYDYEKCIDILMERDGMTQDEAEEYFDFNTLGANMGETTPIFLHNMRAQKI